MHKQNKQSLDKINFVQDLDPKTAAAYSGGKVDIAYTTGANPVSREEFNPDIIFYNQRDTKGSGMMVRAATGEGVEELGIFNDLFKSVEVIRGKWAMATDVNYGGKIGTVTKPGKGNFTRDLRGDFIDSISSVLRYG